MKNLPLSLTVSAVSGALTLLRPADWPPRLRRAFVVVPGTIAAAGLAAVALVSLAVDLMHDPEDGSKSPYLSRPGPEGVPSGLRP